MKVSVKAKPGAKRPGVECEGDVLVVAVKERAADGKANVAVVKAVARYFKVAPSRVHIVSGHGARKKILEIGE